MTILLLLLTCQTLQDELALPKPFVFNNGDRVVFLGSTWIEREQEYGYWETVLTVAYPDKKITFRNLGRSGDTVWGDAWAGFETAKEGYLRRMQLIREQKPSVIFLGFGWNESFTGAAGVSAFRTKYRQFLQDLEPLKARLVFLEPPRVLESDPYVKDVKQRTADQQFYAQVIEELAKETRGHFYPRNFLHSGFYHEADLDQQATPLTALGYNQSGFLLPVYLQLSLPYDVEKEYIRLKPGEKRQHCAIRLVHPPTPPQNLKGSSSQADCAVRVTPLDPGTYSLKIDGRTVFTAPHDAWVEPGVPVTPDIKLDMKFIPKGPSLDQAELLRKTIVEKNKLFFHRIRPQNDTYLFGFRKHEQGQNAKEVPQFEPLIEALEKKIDELKKPKPHTYELIRVGD